jgi:hypothetical protein
MVSWLPRQITQFHVLLSPHASESSIASFNLISYYKTWHIPASKYNSSSDRWIIPGLGITCLTLSSSQGHWQVLQYAGIASVGVWFTEVRENSKYTEHKGYWWDSVCGHGWLVVVL